MFFSNKEKKNNECKKKYLSSFPDQNEQFQNSENEEKIYKIKKGKYLKFTPMFACNNNFNYCIFNLIINPYIFKLVQITLMFFRMIQLVQ